MYSTPNTDQSYFGLVLLLWTAYACAGPLCSNAAAGFLAERQEVGAGCSLH